MYYLARALLALSATAFVWVVFLISHPDVIPWLESIGHPPWVSSATPLVLGSGLIILVTRITIFLIEKTSGKESINQGDIIDIQQVDGHFLPGYLGYFFVALSISSLWAMLSIFILLIVFAWFSQNTYFNPVFLVLGYRFYKIQTQNGSHILLITKAIYKTPKGMEIIAIYRINDYTFMEISSRKRR